MHLVETSERLQEGPAARRWSPTSSRFPGTTVSTTCRKASCFLAANELFDAIPIRQFVKTAQRLSGTAGRARCRRRTDLRGRRRRHRSRLCCQTAAQAAPLGNGLRDRPCPRRGDDDALRTHPRRWRHGCDHRLRPYGDGFRRHAAGGARCISSIRRSTIPGEADLTSHVDFEQLAETAVAVRTADQRADLSGRFSHRRLDLLERAAALGRDKDAETQEGIRADVERLAGAGEGKMGELVQGTGRPQSSDRSSALSSHPLKNSVDLRGLTETRMARANIRPNRTASPTERRNSLHPSKETHR